MATQTDNVQIERQYVDFFDETEEYKQRINSLIEKEEVRLIININDLRREYPERAAQLIDEPNEELSAAQKAFKRVIQNVNPKYAENKDFFVGFEGSFGAKHVTPRSLNATYLGKLVCVEGIITKASLVHPKMVKSVHYCPSTEKISERVYSDMTSNDYVPTYNAHPTKDEEGNNLETEFGLCRFKDHQTLTVQEMPETAPTGQLPRHVEIIVENDLVDQAKPGDRVQIVGQYRCIPGKRNGFTTAIYSTTIISNNVRVLNKDGSLIFSDKDIESMRVVSKRSDIIDLLSRSMAPSIHGHDQVKQAILYQLLGGVEKILDNGTRIRGDVNILLMGDPSVAKSQFLRFVLQIAHRAITTTGRGTTGVGLTAAVTQDQETGERQLEAGAMVLADRGIVCIDEFDKMSDIDRTAIHEVMEQGRVTIAKAGVMASLNARCSVLGAANPVYGRYDQYKTPMENIGLQDSLLSRFDLLFVLLDREDPENDRAIASHVLRAHRFRNPNEADGEAMPLQVSSRMLSTFAQNVNETDERFEENESTSNSDQIYEKNQLLYSDGKQKRDILTTKFIQKYVYVARQLKPKLTTEAASFISEKYCDLRESAEASSGDYGNTILRRTQPITARTLETLIRLSTANAKARMSKTVTVKDAEAAVNMLSLILFKEVLTKNSRKRVTRDSESETEEVEQEEVEEEIVQAEEEPLKKEPKKKRARQQADDSQPSQASSSSGPSGDPYAFTQENVDGHKVPDALYKSITVCISRHFQNQRKDNIPINDVVQHIQDNCKCNKKDAKAALEKMHVENKVLLTPTEVWMI